MLAGEIRAFGGKLRQRLREQTRTDDLTSSQIAGLLRLEKDAPTTVSGLARGEGMRPQSMSAVVAPLLEGRVIGGAPAPSDGRQTLMFLTPKCVKWLEKGRAARQDWLVKAVTEKFSIREQEKLQAALKLLMRLVEE